MRVASSPQLDTVEAGDRHVVRDPQPERLRRAHDAGGEQVGLAHDRRGALGGRPLEQQPPRLLAGPDGEVGGLDHGCVVAGQGPEAPQPALGVGVVGRVVLADEAGDRTGVQGHRHVGEALVAEAEDVPRGQSDRGLLVGADVGDAGRLGRPAADEGYAAGGEVGDDGVVPHPAQGEDGRVEGLGGELADRARGVVGGLGDEEHRAARGLELLGEPVEDGEGERVAEGVAQRGLDEARPRCRPGRGAARRPGGRGRRTRARRRPPAPVPRCPPATGPLPLNTSEAVEVETPAALGPRRAAWLTRGPRLDVGGSCDRDIESIRSNRFDPPAGPPAGPAARRESP